MSFDVLCIHYEIVVLLVEVDFTNALSSVSLCFRILYLLIQMEEVVKWFVLDL